MFFASEWDSFYQVYKGSEDSEGSKQIHVQLTEKGEMTLEALAEFGKHQYLFNPEHINYLNEHLKDNTWIKCFDELTEQELQWIDFETEIQEILEDAEEYSMELPV